MKNMEGNTKEATEKIRERVIIAERKYGDNFFKKLRSFQNAALLDATKGMTDLKRDEAMAELKVSPKYSLHGITKRLATHALDDSVLPCELYK